MPALCVDVPPSDATPSTTSTTPVDEAQAELFEARRQLAFLAEASALLGSSLDYKVTLSTVARMAIPAFADWCMVYLREGDATVPVEIACADPAKEHLLWELTRRWPPSPESRSPLRESHTDGRARVVTEIDDAGLRSMARDADHLAVLRALAPRSMITAPLTLRGETLGVIGLVGDDTRRRYNEGDLWLAEDLGRRAAVAIDNARLYAEAREAIRARDTFLAIASHELKTPLSALLLRIQSMIRHPQTEREDESPAPEPQLAILERNVRRLDTLVNDLLDATRITAGRLTLAPEPMSMTEVVREVAAQFAAAAGRANAPISIVADSPVQGEWDRGRTDQAITNLVSNAIKYGAGHPVEIAVEEAGDRVRVHVRDHGIGIASVDQRRLFQRFERLVSEQRFGGLGLGLWITRQIVEAHGGTITIESAIDEGSTFSIELPRHTDRRG